MSQSFKKLYYQLLIDPITQLQLAGYVVFLLLAVILQKGVFLPLSLVWVLVFFVLSRTASHGHPSWLAVSLTPNFYAVKSFGGRWSIFQRQNKQALSGGRRAFLKGLVEEQKLLPEALAPGRYQAITHNIVLRRLKVIKRASDIISVPIYESNMGTFCRYMIGNRCRHCKKYFQSTCIIKKSGNFIS